jgi:hypothetical protein
MKANKAKLNPPMHVVAVGIITSRHIACVKLTKSLKSEAIVIGFPGGSQRLLKDAKSRAGRKPGSTWKRLEVLPLPQSRVSVVQSRGQT